METMGECPNNNGASLFDLSLSEIIWPRLTVLPAALVRCPIISGGLMEGTTPVERVLRPNEVAMTCAGHCQLRWIPPFAI